MQKTSCTHVNHGLVYVLLAVKELVVLGYIKGVVKRGFVVI